MRATQGRTGTARVLLTLAALGVLGLSGCGQLPEIELPDRSQSGSVQPSASDSAPAETPPATEEPATEEPTTEEPTTEEPPTEEPTSEEPAAPEPSDSEIVALPPASDSPSEEPSSSEPTEEPTTEAPTSEEPTSSTPTEEPESPTPTESTPEESPSETDSDEPTDEESSEPASDEDGGLPLWIPIVAVGGLALGAILLLAGRSRSRRWDDQLGVERTQAQWVLDELLPAVTNPTTSAADHASHWGAAQTTLDQLSGGLAALIADAPDAGRGAAAQTLSGALAEVRQAVSADLALRGSAGSAPPEPGSVGPEDATVVAPAGPGGAGPADPSALAASSARVASARDRLAAALATQS